MTNDLFLEAKKLREHPEYLCGLSPYEQDIYRELDALQLETLRAVSARKTSYNILGLKMSTSQAAGEDIAPLSRQAGALKEEIASLDALLYAISEQLLPFFERCLPNFA